MRYDLSLVLICVLFTFGCDKLSKAFDDIQDEAPSVCQKMCDDSVDCEQKDAVFGNQNENYLQDLKERCIVDCAFSINSGVFVQEIDNEEPIEMLISKLVPGADYHDYLECIVDFYECTEMNRWQLAMTVYDEKENCEKWSTCIEILNIDFSAAWDADLETCRIEGEEQLLGHW